MKMKTQRKNQKKGQEYKTEKRKKKLAARGGLGSIIALA